MPAFLQSSEWEELQRAYGRKTWRVFETLIIRHDLPGRFNYLYCPRPSFSNQSLVIDNFFSAVGKIAREEKSIFLKIDPGDPWKSDFSREVRLPEVRPSNSLQPRKTLILDLNRPEEEILSRMHEKTRYNIRLAEKKKVQIRKKIDFEIFWNMLQETAKRDRFYTHPKSYYEKLIAVKTENFSNELFFAEQDGNILAVALVNLFRPSGIATYLHGASSSRHREVMAPYLLHWRIIQELKRRSLNGYDWGGTDEVKWPGVTRFKKGFGGEAVEFPPAVDIVFRPHFYRLFKFVNFLRAEI